MINPTETHELVQTVGLPAMAGGRGRKKKLSLPDIQKKIDAMRKTAPKEALSEEELKAAVVSRLEAANPEPVTDDTAQPTRPTRGRKKATMEGLPPVGLDRLENSWNRHQVDTITPPSFLVENLIPREGLTLFCGDAKIGKSFFVLDLCVSVTYGRPFLGVPMEQGKAVYLGLEDSKARILHRLEDLAGDAPHDPETEKNLGSRPEHLVCSRSRICSETTV